MRQIKYKKIELDVVQNESSISVFLLDVLEQRRERNPRYSMRAFARDLGLSPGRLSDFLSGRRVPGKQLTLRIISSLDLKHEEAQKLMHLIERHKMLHAESGGAYQLNEDQFSMIADREHFAILNLMKTDNYVPKISWIAKRLGFSEVMVAGALHRLERLGLVAKEQGLYQPVHKAVTTTHDIPSAGIREHHRQILTHTMNSLFHDDTKLRDITSMGIPVNPEKLEEAKKIIRDFRRKIANLLEDGKKTEVYYLNVQLVPATREAKDKDGK
ncbi:TIGR02147 family protein [Bdellovibrio sp.]|uniref:TIGR02147 family protein n=1 Tax=Bdellovibrio sp. TaxID=28201 RepID=UPI0039E6797B